MNPLISIITPNYNKGEFIQEMIDSVLNQSYSNFELIIVDDGSSDNSIQIIEEFDDKRIKLIKRDHQLKNGGSICRNIGVKEALGDYIMFLDSDDLLNVSCLKNRLTEIEKELANDLWLFTTGTFYKQMGDCQNIWNLPTKNHLQLFLQHDLPFNIMAPIWKSSFIKRLNGFDESFPRLQDVELHTRALLKAKVKYQISNLKEPDCYYRIAEKRIISSYNEFIFNWVYGTIKYINKFYPILGKKNKKFLKGTLFSIINQLNYFLKVEKIDNQFYNTQLSRLFDETPYKKGIYIKGYNFLFSIGLSNIKGFNYISKKIFIHLN